jgi:hypothetical protein
VTENEMLIEELDSLGAQLDALQWNEIFHHVDECQNEGLTATQTLYSLRYLMQSLLRRAPTFIVAPEVLQ